MFTINDIDFPKNTLDAVHPTWRGIVLDALNQMDPGFLSLLATRTDWLPGQSNLLRAFSQPLENTRFLLFGESPYPRPESANGYAFLDAAVGPVWSENGLSKAVNRATSLRNWIKALLLAENHLQGQPTKEAIAQLDKTNLVQSLDELFQNMQSQGIVLLNASLTLIPDMSVRKQGQYWVPFINQLLEGVRQDLPNTELILFGKIAKEVLKIPAAQDYYVFTAEHPYNLSFITNQDVHTLFGPMKFLTGNKHVA